eukprot:TRINITY_DN8660_c0_g1_i1.p1 TRINITY_DN8660_c0_g1~~TRINITY_DN8660_c0_g1_i1.p1  ORF type:complete len:507 (+),score=114.91 TRINITY_DN8660_c0_g1_i1:84-1604(+)
MNSDNRLKLERVFTRRILPSKRSSPQTKKLSILDNSAVYSPKNRAVYAYNAKEDGSSISPDDLARSIGEFLSEQPFWAGQLEPTEFLQDGGHQHRLGCLQITYGKDSDPGVSLSFAKSALKLDDCVPSFNFESEEVFSRSDFPFNEFLSVDPIATDDPKNLVGFPIFSVQLIQFSCGGITIAIIVPHYLGDAPSFTHVIEDIARATRGEQSIPRYFDAATVDSIAGDLNNVDMQRIDLHRRETNDMWASAKDVPEAMLPACIPPPQVAHLAEPFGKAIDWKTCLDFSPVQPSHTFFTPEEVHNMYIDATSNGQKISHLDAFNAHLWLETTAANNVKEGEGISFAFPLDIRRRVNLPESQIGNLNTAKFTDEINPKSSIAEAASIIRKTILTVTKESISDVVLCMAFETTPTRYLPWLPRCPNTTITTSWLSDDIAGTDFGLGKPRYFDTRTSTPIKNFHILTTIPCDDKTKQWYERGVIVTSFFKDLAMENFTKSKTLRKYRKSVN